MKHYEKTQTHIYYTLIEEYEWLLKQNDMDKSPIDVQIDYINSWLSLDNNEGDHFKIN